MQSCWGSRSGLKEREGKCRLDRELPTKFPLFGHFFRQIFGDVVEDNGLSARDLSENPGYPLFRRWERDKASIKRLALMGDSQVSAIAHKLQKCATDELY